MDDTAPQMPAPDERPQRAEDPVPNPHRTEPLPEPQEGMRPGAEQAVRPEQDEEVGPLEGLLTSTSAQASSEASEVVGDEDLGAEALLAKMGVEEEGIESGQLLGLVASVLAAIIAMAVILIYLFYIPTRTAAELDAEGNAEYQELEVVRTEGRAKLGQYTRTDATYGLPIEGAMGVVVAQYGTRNAAANAAALPVTRQSWNTLPVMRGMGEAVQDVDRADIEPRFDDPALRRAAIGDATEEVGVDAEAVPTVRVIDNDVEAIIE